MPTASTLPLLLLVLLLWRWTRGNLLAIVAFTSIFDGASALNFGAMGIAPWIFSLAVCLPVRILQRRQRIRPAEPISGMAAHGLAAFFVWQTLSAFINPILFSGILVRNQADLVPLNWGMPNVAQLCYMLLSALLLFLTVVSDPQELPEAIAWYIRGCITAALFAVYQLLHAALHIPFPDAILYSSAAHTVYHAYTIGGMWRLNSTFTEASDMAGSLIGGLAILVWDFLRLPFKAGRFAAAFLVGAAILATLSTTGYLCLAVLLFCGLVLAARQLWQERCVSMKRAATGFSCALACLLAFTLSPSLRSNCVKIVHLVVMDKNTFDSYQASQDSHEQALRTLRETSYLGAGLGSTRARGLLYTLLAGSGVPGLLSFVFAVAALFAASLRGARPQEPGERALPSPGIVLGLFLIFVAMVLAGSEPVYPVFWLFFGVCLRQNNSVAGRIAAGSLAAPVREPFWIPELPRAALVASGFGARKLAPKTVDLGREAGCN